MRFRIITDSWNKTDRQDARNMAMVLWVFLVTGEFGIATVYKPSETIRMRNQRAMPQKNDRIVPSSEVKPAKWRVSRGSRFAVAEVRAVSEMRREVLTETQTAGQFGGL